SSFGDLGKPEQLASGRRGADLGRGPGNHRNKPLVSVFVRACV
ncbi:hypothetical protein pipiens_013487, partial [Culex pipiens pipiens]